MEGLLSTGPTPSSLRTGIVSLSEKGYGYTCSSAWTIHHISSKAIIRKFISVICRDVCYDYDDYMEETVKMIT